MMWVGMCSKTRTEFVVVDQRLRAIWCVEEILQDRIAPFMIFIGRKDFVIGRIKQELILLT